MYYYILAFETYSHAANASSRYELAVVEFDAVEVLASHQVLQ